MNHSFSIEIAKQIGVDCAIVYENIKFWCAKNKANNKHLYNNEYWTYNSVKAFEELFPYWTSKQIRTILDKLELSGLIGTGNYNSSPYDRTKWYSDRGEMCFKSLDNTICPFGQMDVTKRANQNAQMGKCITDINTDINTNKNKDNTSVCVLSEKEKEHSVLVQNNGRLPIIDLKKIKEEKFELFWDMYDKKNERKSCFSKFTKLSMNVIDKILLVVPDYVISTPDIKYRKHPETWLNGECWNDEIATKAKQMTEKKITPLGLEDKW